MSTDKRIAEDFIYLPTLGPVQLALCLLAAFMWLFITKLGAFFHLHDFVLGGIEGDPGIYVWLARGLELNRWPTFETNAFYPYGQTLAFTDNFIFPGLIYSAFSYFFVDGIFAYNLTYITFLLVGALCSSILIYALCEELIPSVFAGMLMVSFAPLGGHLGHPQLQTFFCFPLLIFLMLRYLQCISFVRALPIGLTIAITFQGSAYYAVFSALLCLLFFFGFFLIHPKKFTLQTLLPLGGSALVAAFVLFPLVMPYLSIKDLFGERGLYEAAEFAATPVSYFAFTPFSWIYGSLNGLSHSEAWLGSSFIICLLSIFTLNSVFEGRMLSPVRVSVLGTLFISISASLLFPAGTFLNFLYTAASWSGLLFFARALYQLGVVERSHRCAILTNRDILAIILWCAACFIVISLGPLFLSRGSLSLSPFTLMYHLFPGMDAVRAIGRAGIPAAIFIVFAAIVGTTHQFRRKKISAVLFVVALAFILLENICDKYPLDQPLPRPKAFTELKALSNGFGGGAAIMLPYAGELDKNGAVRSWSEFARDNVYAMNWFLEIPLRSINGFSGQRTKIMTELPRRLKNFPDEGSLRELSSFYGLTYIVVVPTLYPQFNAEIFKAELNQKKSELELISTAIDGSYLLALRRAQRLDPQFILKSPGYERSAHISFGILESCTDPYVQVKIFEADNLTPFSTIQIPTDQKMHRFTVPLPAMKNSSRVRRSRFETSGSCVVSMQTQAL